METWENKEKGLEKYFFSLDILQPTMYLCGQKILLHIYSILCGFHIKPLLLMIYAPQVRQMLGLHCLQKVFPPADLEIDQPACNEPPR